MSHFKEHKVVPLATASDDGPRVRPVTVVPHEGKVYTLTGARDAKMTHLRDDPRFEVYVLVEEDGSTGYVRFMGRVMMVEDLDLRKEVGDTSGFAWNYFTGPEDPNYALLEMVIRKAEVMRPGAKGYEILSR
jgi:general stress protein 26